MKFLFSVTLLFCSLFSLAQNNISPVAHQGTTENYTTPEEKLLQTAKAFMDLYNTGDSVRYRDFLLPKTSNEAQLRNLLMRYQNTFRFIGAVHVVQIKPVSANRAEAWARDKQFDAWWKFTINTDSLQQFRDRTVEPAGFTRDFLATGKLSEQQIVAETDRYITEKLGSQFNGNVFIAKNDRVIYSRSFGAGPDKQPNTSDRLFGLASLGKMFTALSILQLRDKGLLSLEDTVGRFIPSIKRPDIAAITIRQLLNHSSGMGDYFESPLYQKIKDSIRSPKDMLPVIEADKPRFPAGTGWAYSNTGFTVLGIIIENLSGTSFEDWVGTHIFKPAGMKTAKAGGAAGGGEASIEDLRAFSRSLLTHRLTSKATTEEWLSYTVNDGKYGLGSEHQQLGEDYLFGHSGGFINVCTELNLYLKSGYTVIILSNSNPPFGHFLSNKLKELLVRKS